MFSTPVARKAKVQRLKFSDADDDITAGDDVIDDSEAAHEVNQSHTFEEDEPVSNDNCVEDVQGFAEPSTDAEVEELMAGICPEDLSFSTSYIGLTTPQKNVNNLPQPLHESTPNVNSSHKNVTSPSPIAAQHARDITRASTNDPVKISKSVVEKVNKVLGPEFQGFKLSSEIKNLKQCDQLTVYPEGTFYGLPEDISKCLEEFKGIKKLYGKDG